MIGEDVFHLVGEGFVAKGVAINPNGTGLLGYLVAEDIGQELGGGPFDDVHEDFHDLGRFAGLGAFGHV